MLLDEPFETVSSQSDMLTDLLPSNFDFVWMQHGCLPEPFIRDLVSCDCLPVIISAHLSPYRECLQEFPYAGEFEDRVSDLIVFNSEATLLANRPFHEDCDKFALYPNPVPISFIEGGLHRCPAFPDKILVVSNHPPEELLKALSLVENEGVQISFLSDTLSNGQPRIISPDVLRSFDCVVTIGKTVQYCLVMGIPVYIYDHFGGGGYLTESNFALMEHYNFTGRVSSDGCSLVLAKRNSFDRKKTPEFIMHDILGGYSAARAFQGEYRSEFVERYRIDRCLQSLYAMATKNHLHSARLTSACCERAVHAQYAFRELLAAQRLYIQSGNRFYTQQKVQLFHCGAEEADFAEERSDIYCLLRSPHCELEINSHNYASIRLDPGELPCIISHLSVGAGSENVGEIGVFVPCDVQVGASSVFFHGDPQIIIHPNEGRLLPEILTVSFDICPIDDVPSSLLDELRCSNAEMHEAMIEARSRMLREDDGGRSERGKSLLGYFFHEMCCQHDM